MNTTERISIALRHNRHLKNAHGVWNVVRPVYNRILARKYRHGLERLINGTDRILVSIRARSTSEEYEPDVWGSLMKDVYSGDTIADVGAYHGLYAVALAKRVGPNGRVVAFEPSDANRLILRDHVRLNKVKSLVEIVPTAVGNEVGHVSFRSDNFSESHVVSTRVETPSAESVKIQTLDHFFDGKRLDILKIDVEGFEEKVLQGAQMLLADKGQGPRVVYIEVHPFAWEDVGTTSESLLGLLHKQGFEVFFVDGQPVQRIEEYGEIIARRTS